MERIVHYKDIKFSKKLIPATESSYNTLKECKRIREDLGGSNRHYEQSCRIPDIFDKDVPLFYHRECRSKFTNIQTLVKRKFTQDNTNEISKKRAPRKESFFFPNHCMICKKARTSVNKKEIKLSKIITKTAEETLVKAATLKNDYEMFINKFETENQTIDICNLPPCWKNLYLHIKRSNYVSSIYKNANLMKMELKRP